MVWSQSLPLTMVESHTLAMNRRYYPELVVHFTLGDPKKLAWATHPHNRHLQKEVAKWFATAETRKYIQGLVDYYFSHLENFDYVDMVRFRRRIQARLPKYQSWFEQAAAKYGLDWQLVAAQAYQESHWNPRAKSFTGVRGIMMLTLDTAKSMGLKNRLEAKESIFAGTRYMAKLHRMVGDEVPEPDRTLMALAAYNIGYGHLQDARALAQRMGKPSNTWHGVRSVFPLLQKKKYYRTLKHGYARGNEAVQYVDRIRTYHKVLIMAMLPHTLSGMGG
jgi:membrane-bound lytic murein transglycosylase F